MTNPNENIASPLLRQTKDLDGCRPTASPMTQPLVSIDCGKLSSQLAALSLPPLEQISLCSDDSDSLSSVSSDGSSYYDRTGFASVSSSPNQRRRSVFKTYWEKKGGAPLELRGRSSDSDNDNNDVNISQHEDCSQNSCSSTALESNDTANSYERTLKVKEGIEHLPSALDSNNRRRRIFTACPSLLMESPERQLPGLCFDYQNNVRLVQSSPELRRTPGPSCLQRSFRYSGDKRRNFGRSSSCSVSFDPNVSILRYRETKENWAASGWSKYFAN